MDFPKRISDLLWQPVGTLTQATIPSEQTLCRETLQSKLFVHKRTRIKKQNCFLIFQVDNEEAVVGPVFEEKNLQEVFQRRQPKTFQLSCGDLIRMIEDDDPTDADMEVLAEIGRRGKDCVVVEEGDEGSAFFLDLCAYIKDRNLYRTAEGKDKPSLSNEDNAPVATE